jgi:hypothetical protein
MGGDIHNFRLRIALEKRKRKHAVRVTAGLADSIRKRNPYLESAPP